MHSPTKRWLKVFNLMTALRAIKHEFYLKEGFWALQDINIQSDFTVERHPKW